VSLPAAAAPRPAPPPAAAGTVPEPARVLVCDDSVVIRAAIARMLESDPEVRVVSRVGNGQLAVDAVTRQRIDVVVLDIEMPVLDGLSALPLLLRADPTLRIIMASTLTTRGADIALRALRLGAADYLPKPSTAQIQDDSFRNELLAKVKGLARLHRRARLPAVSPSALPSASPPPLSLRPLPRQSPLLLAIGSSTGGPQALFSLVQGLGSAVPVPVVLTQHMPATFTPLLAEHLTRVGGLPCAEAQHGERLRAGRIYLAPGNRHLLVEGTPEALVARLSDAPAENFCRPSVDPMLRSAGAACGGRVLVVMLTGMGRDGLAGTRQVVEAGGAALAQDEATSVVWGMPGAIAQAGLCHQVLPLPALPGKVLDLLRAPRPAARRT
jgi:two-component system chemotaxis response regulator CheB